MKNNLPIFERGNYEAPRVDYSAVIIEAGFAASSGGNTETMPEEGQDPWSSDMWSWK